jgi:hypothetical protein
MRDTDAQDDKSAGKQDAEAGCGRKMSGSRLRPKIYGGQE